MDGRAGGPHARRGTAQFEILEAPVAVEAVDRRESDRWTALGDVILRWLDEDGVLQSVEGQMVDRSVTESASYLRVSSLSATRSSWFFPGGRKRKRSFVTTKTPRLAGISVFELSTTNVDGTSASRLPARPNCIGPATTRSTGHCRSKLRTSPTKACSYAS